MTTYIDIDGVLADWIGGVERKFGFIAERSTYNIHGQLGLTWAQLDSLLDGEFYSELGRLDGPDTTDAILVTSAGTGLHRDAADQVWGRMEWVRTWYPNNKLIFIHDKSLLAREGDILVDDLEDNIKGWEKAGGTGILWPAPYNHRRNECKHRD